MRNRNSEVSLRDFYRIVFRHLRKSLLFFCLVIIATAAYLFYAPKSYLSEGKLFVRLGRENVGLDPTATLGQNPMVAVPHSREDEINSVVDLLLSRPLVEQVVEKIGAHTILGETEKGESSPLQTGVLTAHEKAIIKLEKGLDVSPVKKTTVIRVAYTASSAELAQDIVSELMHCYLAEHVKMNRTPHSHEFLQKQTQRIRDDLTAAENKLRDLQNQTGLSAPQEQRDLIVRRVSSLQEELANTQRTLDSAIAEARLLRRSLSGVDNLQVTVRNNGLAMENRATEEVRRELYSLQLREQELRAKYTDEHFEVVRIREQIAATKKLISRVTGVQSQSEEATSGNTANSSSLYAAGESPAELIEQEPALAALAAKAGALRTQLEEAEQDLILFNDSGLQVAKLQREIELLDASYRKYAASLEQSRIDESMQAERITNISIAQPATINHKPASPKKMLTVLAGFFLATGGALALAFGSEFADHTCKSADDVEHKLQLPVLATIPKVNSRRMFPVSNN